MNKLLFSLLGAFGLLLLFDRKRFQDQERQQKNIEDTTLANRDMDLRERSVELEHERFLGEMDYKNKLLRGQTIVQAGCGDCDCESDEECVFGYKSQTTIDTPETRKTADLAPAPQDDVLKTRTKILPDGTRITFTSNMQDDEIASFFRGLFGSDVY
jgi:hypothetical protein